MSDKLKFLTINSLNKKIGTKWFKIINVFLILAVISLINIDTIINFFGGNFDKDTEIMVIDNTGKSYGIFETTLKDGNNLLGEVSTDKLIVMETDKDEDVLMAEIDDNKTIVIVFDEDEEDVLRAKIITTSYIDAVLHQKIIASINIVKSSLAILRFDIDIEQLGQINTPAPIERIYIDESKTQSEENMGIIMGVVFPTLIFPFFMLIIILVQMLGAEINEEKTTRGMEIIISNVSPRTHFISKIISSNLFVIIQASILFLASLGGIFIRSRLSTTAGSILPDVIDLNGLWNQLVESGFADKLMYIIPLTILLLILSFIAYSLLAGILASMTTSMEDYQQLQMPIIFISVTGYYLSVLAPMFEGSIFIRFVSYIPFISSLMAPALLAIGHITIIDMGISIMLLIGVIYFMSTYGLKIYKVGILNYSTTKLWSKMFKAMRE